MLVYHSLSECRCIYYYLLNFSHRFPPNKLLMVWDQPHSKDPSGINRRGGSHVGKDGGLCHIFASRHLTRWHGVSQNYSQVGYFNKKCQKLPSMKVVGLDFLKQNSHQRVGHWETRRNEAKKKGSHTTHTYPPLTLSRSLSTQGCQGWSTPYIGDGHSSHLE